MEHRDGSVAIDPVKTPHSGMEYGDWVQNYWWPAVVDTLSDRSRGSYRSTLNKLILPTFELTPLDEIHITSIRAWVSNLNQLGHGYSALDSAIRVFRTTMVAAMAKGLIRSNPLAGVRLAA